MERLHCPLSMGGLSREHLDCGEEGIQTIFQKRSGYIHLLIIT